MVFAAVQPLGAFISCRLGFADTDVDRTLEEAIKSMYPEEKSDFTLRIKLSPKKNNLTLPIKEDVW
jgi:hypothetical protein